jgi:hypothetical protein
MDYDSSNNIEPWDTWAGSMMAQAGRDPLFWAALDVANNDIADVGDYCLRCHAPTGWLAGRSEPQTDGCALEGKIDEKDKDFDGLTCHFCHRMMINSSPPGGQEPVYFENGQYWIDDAACPGGGEPCRHGPYDYPTGPEAPHEWAFSAYHVAGQNCGNCHNVTHPVNTLIQDGVDTGIPMPIERTFKEWQQSVYGPGGANELTCQNCHMPDTIVTPAYASSDGLYNRTGDLALHRFAGGNAWIPEVLRLEYPNLDLDGELTTTRGWALEKLQQQSATVEVIATTEILEGAPLDIQVKVTNHTGHKLPTGYPEGRRMWLHVEARDGLGSLIWESGAYDPATGVLTKDAQIKIYHTEPGVWEFIAGSNNCDTENDLGEPIFHFVLNNCIAVDNRIPPQGFTGMNDVETQPVNYGYPETSPDSGILVNYDVTDYSIPVAPATPSPISVTATLRYQTASKDYIDFLLRESDDNAFPNDCIERSVPLAQTRAEILFDMWNSHGKSAPVDMDSDGASATVLTPTPGEASTSPDVMTVTDHDTATGDISISYHKPCEALDHTVYFGDLSAVSAMTFSGQACFLGDTGSATFNPGAGDVFWVIVSNDAVYEGSYGTDNGGNERDEDTALLTCNYPQELARRCD